MSPACDVTQLLISSTCAMCPLPLVTAPVPNSAAPTSCSSSAVRFSACQAADIRHEQCRLAPAPFTLPCSICALASVWLPARRSAAQHLEIRICLWPITSAL